MTENGFSLKLGRFYKDDKILQYDEVLDLLNEYGELKNDYKTLQLQYDNLNEYRKELHDENEQLKSDCDYRWKKYCNTRKEMLHEIEQLKREKKSQELEIVRLHNLADSMSSVLRELGIYDVYNKEQIKKVKEYLE